MRWVFLFWNSFVYFVIFGVLPACFLSALFNLYLPLILIGIFLIFLLPRTVPFFSGLIVAFFGAKQVVDKELRGKRKIVDEIRWRNPSLELSVFKFQSNFPNVIGVTGFHNRVFVCFHEDLLNQITDEEFKIAINIFLLRRRNSHNVFENFNVLSLCLIGLLFKSFRRKKSF